MLMHLFLENNSGKNKGPTIIVGGKLAFILVPSRSTRLSCTRCKASTFLELELKKGGLYINFIPHPTQHLKLEYQFLYKQNLGF